MNCNFILHFRSLSLPLSLIYLQNVCVNVKSSATRISSSYIPIQQHTIRVHQEQLVAAEEVDGGPDHDKNKNNNKCRHTPTLHFNFFLSSNISMCRRLGNLLKYYYNISSAPPPPPPPPHAPSQTSCMQIVSLRARGKTP